MPPLISAWLRRGRALVAAAAIASVALAACVRDGSPQLIQVLDVSPHEVEVGDKIAVFGAGFPQGRPAHLAFRGKLYRPGERPLEDVEIEARAAVDDAQRITLPFDATLAALFAGVGDRAAHTTFDGELEVAFAAAAPGAPPIAATLYKVVLDVRPAAPPAAVVAARETEGGRALAFAGIAASPIAPAAGGIAVDKVAPGSRADEAGLVAGDLIVRFDGVRVGGPSDAAPRPGARAVPVVIRRDGDPREIAKEIDYGGFKSAAPVELFGAAIVLAVALALILFFVAPTTRGFVWIERGVAPRLAAINAGARGKGARAWLDALVVGPARARAFAPLALASAIVFATSTSPWFQRLDVATLFASIAAALVAVALLRRPSAGGALASAGHALAALIPMAIAVAAAIVATGSLHVGDVVAGQGGAPWRWYAFRSPAMLALFLASVVGALGDASRPGGVLAETAAEPSARAGVASDAIVATSALVTLVFLGGWLVPGVSPAQASATTAVIGGALAVAKLVAVAAVLTIAKRLLPPLPRARLSVVTLKVSLPVSLVALAAVVAEARWVGPRGAVGIGAVVSAALVALAAVAVVHVVYRVVVAVRTPGARGQLNPFL